MTKKTLIDNSNSFNLFENLSEEFEDKVSHLNNLKNRIITRENVKREVKPLKISNFQSIMENLKILYNKKLKSYENQCKVIVDKESLLEYIKIANNNKIIAIDTETTSLDTHTTTLVGISLYTPKQQAVYIPVNHIDYITLQRINNQINKDDLLYCLRQIKAKILMHNSLFDMKVLHYTIDYDCKIYWDTYILERLLTNGYINVSAALKPTYSRYMNLSEPALSFDSYFKGITFDKVPISIGSVYAAMDAKMTYTVYRNQKKIIQEKDFEGIKDLFLDIEMPIISVVYSMMLRGITFDLKYNEQLLDEFNKKLSDIKKDIYEILEDYKVEISSYNRDIKNKTKLNDPINIDSPAQIAILLYDIMKVGTIDSKSPRGTGEEILKKIDNKFTNLLLEERALTKLVTTYLIKLPKEVKNHSKIYTSFNPVGTVTGRFSSESPNLQNIPAKDVIRRIFTADNNKYLISCDYSSQEPRIIAHLSQDNLMIKAFKENKDFYAFLGSHAYKREYEECKEFYPNGKPNPEGKKIRTYSKNAFLGICYGMKANSLAKQLEINLEDAQYLLNLILKTARGLQILLKDMISFGKSYGYVETIWGRRRYLKYIGGPEFEIKFSNKSKILFDPLNFEEDFEVNMYEEEEKIWMRKLKNCKSYIQRNELIENARKEGILIIDNIGHIKEDERYCINTPVQGSAADMTKISMINIENNRDLKELGFELLLTVHDEVIGQAPKENISQIVPILEECMLQHTRDFLVPFKVDTVVSKEWGGESIEFERI